MMPDKQVSAAALRPYWLTHIPVGRSKSGKPLRLADAMPQPPYNEPDKRLRVIEAECDPTECTTLLQKRAMCQRTVQPQHNIGPSQQRRVQCHSVADLLAGEAAFDGNDRVERNELVNQEASPHTDSLWRQQHRPKPERLDEADQVHEPYIAQDEHDDRGDATPMSDQQMVDSNLNRRQDQ